MDQGRNLSKRWQIAVCDRGTVHVHYGTGSLHISQVDFLGLARELKEIAAQLEIRSSTNGNPSKGAPMQ
jgi:hypothetical protein